MQYEYQIIAAEEDIIQFWKLYIQTKITYFMFF